MTMQVFTSKRELRQYLDVVRQSGQTVGFVPTMGALHRGHLSLVESSQQSCDVHVMSIFVNPLQFGAGDDFEKYPRQLEEDLEKARAAGVDVVFTPDTNEMYETETHTTVHVSDLTERFEGEFRPGHFDGVTTVVAKLFNIVGPCRAFFGEKDFQQLVVVKKMVADLDIPVEVIGCPTLRESDGLAMSSRNVYLQPDERIAATVLHRTLRAGVALIEAGERDRTFIEEHMASIVAAEPLAHLEYVAIVDPETLASPEQLRSGTSVRLLIVAKVGTPRLLDNIGAEIN